MVRRSLLILLSAAFAVLPATASQWTEQPAATPVIGARYAGSSTTGPPSTATFNSGGTNLHADVGCIGVTIDFDPGDKGACQQTPLRQLTRLLFVK